MRLRKLLSFLALLLLLAGIAGGALLWWGLTTLEEPFRGYGGPERVVMVEPGSGVTRILNDLQRAGVIVDRRLGRVYLEHKMGNPALRAGEYRFHEPMTLPQVLDKLVRGDVVTYGVTLVEGWSLDETADHLEAKGFGDREAFLTIMGSPRLIADLDPLAQDLEGYLFPDTYRFPRGTSEEAIVGALVDNFRRKLRLEVEPLRPPADQERPTLRELVTLASIVEKEAQVAEERPLIAGVYANRLKRNIALYADPTVIFALKILGRWDGNLRRSDLQVDSPYNTYRYPGLPPGPIASPGLGSLQAAAKPAEIPHIYFVSRNDGTHVFSQTLAEHNRNVYEWQKRYWARRWAQKTK